jgi:hypothetical protein
LFNTTAPTGGDYAGGTTDLVITTDKDAGDVAGAFEGDEDVDDMGLDVTKNLFVRFELPPTSNTGGQQTVTVTVTAEITD